jgi:hypothetical protein
MPSKRFLHCLKPFLIVEPVRQNTKSLRVWRNAAIFQHNFSFGTQERSRISSMCECLNLNRSRQASVGIDSWMPLVVRHWLEKCISNAKTLFTGIVPYCIKLTGSTAITKSMLCPNQSQTATCRNMPISYTPCERKGIKANYTGSQSTLLPLL